VNLDALERLGAPAIHDAVRRGWLVVIDEIGKMEMASLAFRQAVEEALRSPVTVLGTILSASHPWADPIKTSRGVRLIEVTEGNRDALPGRLDSLLSRSAIDRGHQT
ncbi:MAG: nucleoside-triphosphatase, partial [Candidatus Rokuibacteriota bacterium]